jgi:hypothetical protein
MSSRQLLKYQARFFFDKKEKFFPQSLEGEPNKVYGRVEADPETRDLVFLYYCTYARDAGTKLFGIKVGAHTFDAESVCIITDAEGVVVKGVGFRPHSQKEHFIIDRPDDIGKIFKSGKLHVFVAHGKHGNYPVDGVVHRFLLLKDVCRKPRLRDLELVEVDDNMLEEWTQNGKASVEWRVRWRFRKFFQHREYADLKSVKLDKVRTRMRGKAKLGMKLLWG